MINNRKNSTGFNNYWWTQLLILSNEVIKVSKNCCTRFSSFTRLTFPCFFLLHHLYLASIMAYSASKAPHGSSWVAASLSFPLMLPSHWAVACSIRAERTPGSLPEVFTRRSPPLPAHLSDPLEWSTIVLVVIWWLHSSDRQSWEAAPHPPSTSIANSFLSFFFVCYIPWFSK